MPHQCVHCSKIYPIGSKELLEGCSSCKGRFFFYIRDDQLKKAEEAQIATIPPEEKKQIEKDVREMAGIVNDQEPVILDLESVRILGPGKYEIDVVNLFNKRRPLIYKIEEGKYIIDLSSLKQPERKDGV